MYQELILCKFILFIMINQLTILFYLGDLPNTRYIRNVTSFSDNLQWHNVTCSGLEDARGTWDNEKFKDVINICKNYSPNLKCIVTGDENGFIRLFAYPCYDTKVSLDSHLSTCNVLIDFFPI